MHEPILRVAVLTALLAPTALAQRQLLTIQGTQADSNFGTTLAVIADRDGDGRRDLVVGAPDFDFGAVQNAGRITVVSSGTGNPLAVHNGTALNLRLGTQVTGLGDSNGDGVPDFAASAPSFGLGTGLVVVCSGLTGLTLAQFTGEPLSDFGTSIAGLPDVTGDGLADLAVGAPRDSISTGAGMVRYFSVPNGLHHQIVGDPGANFGASIAAIGDVNGDGSSELAIGSPAHLVSGLPRGRVVLCDPRFGGTASRLWTWNGSATTGDGQGTFVAAAGDRNLDGIPDVITGNGVALAVPLSGTTGSPSPAYTYGANFIRTAANLGDIDGEGHDDLAIGHPDANGGDGEVQILRYGQPAEVLSGTPGSRFGTSVVGLGDVDGDGRDDFAVGAPGFVANGVAVGQVVVFTHRITGTTASIGTACGGSSGAAILTLVGAPNYNTSCSLRATGVHPSHPGFWLLGFSRTSLNGQTLPMSLTPFGFPQCTLRTSAEVVGLFLPGGNTVVNYPLPTQVPAVIGLNLYCQTSQVAPNGDLALSAMRSIRFGNQ